MHCAIFLASLDGYIARTDGGLDWLPGDGAEEHGSDEFMASVDALLIGRKTLETVPGFGGWACGTKPVFVLSRTLQSLNVPAEAICEPVSGEPAEVVAQLASRGFQQLYVDGGVTIRGFIAAGLIDRMTITRIPVLLGSGISLFGALSRDVRRTHVQTRAYPSGIVQSGYQLSR